VLSESILEDHDRQFNNKRLSRENLEQHDQQFNKSEQLEAHARPVSECGTEVSFATVKLPPSVALVDDGKESGHFTHSGLLSGEERVRACEASNHLLNAFVKGRPELITTPLLAQLPDGHDTRLQKHAGGFYEMRCAADSASSALS